MKKVIQKLQQFNLNPNFRLLREKYSCPSFFEMMSISRKENQHSAFLAWLLEGKDINIDQKYSPLLCFLDILVSRDGQHNSKENIPIKLRDAILTRQIRLSDITVTTEKSISDFGIIETSQDRIDVFINCKVDNVPGVKELSIIIENKVGSVEGDAKLKKCNIPDSVKNKEQQDLYKRYIESKQTDRYVIGTKKERKESNKEMLYVYLTPISSYKLSKFDELDNDEKSYSESFININYQDLVDFIIDPLTSAGNLSDRVRLLLEEYLNNLSIPYMDEDEDSDINNTIIMAIQKGDVSTIKQLWDEYGDLILDGLSLYYPIQAWGRDDRSNMMVDVIRKELVNINNKSTLDTRFGKGVLFELSNGKKCPKCYQEILGGEYAMVNVMTKRITFRGMKQKKHVENRIDCDFYDLLQKPVFNNLKLQYDFFNENKKIFLIMMNILASDPDSRYDEIRDIYEAITNTRDYTKYFIRKHDQLLNPIINGNPKELNKRDIVKTFVQNLGTRVDIPWKNGKSIMEYINDKDSIGLKTVCLSSEENVNNSRYERYRWNETNYEICLPGEDFDIYFSNQWGILSNGNGSFDKFLKFISENPDLGFTIMNQQIYLENL